VSFLPELDAQFPLNYLGHKFVYVQAGSFHCNVCKCTATYYLSLTKNFNPRKICQSIGNGKYIPLLSCDELIIKNIIE
jgi:hypothetical protein